MKYSHPPKEPIVSHKEATQSETKIQNNHYDYDSDEIPSKKPKFSTTEHNIVNPKNNTLALQLQQSLSSQSKEPDRGPIRTVSDDSIFKSKPNNISLTHSPPKKNSHQLSSLSITSDSVQPEAKKKKTALKEPTIVTPTKTSNSSSNPSLFKDIPTTKDLKSHSLTNIFKSNNNKKKNISIIDPKILDLSIPPTTKGIRTLAFPSLGTSKYHQLNPLKATEIMVRTVYSFLKDHPDEKMKLFLVERKNSPVIQAIKQHIDNSEKRFGIISGKSLVLTQLKSQANVSACYLVNEITWRMNSKGPETNKLIHSAAGTEFTELTKERYNVGQVSETYPIAVPTKSALCQEENVYCVIHIVLPNINPTKPDALPPDSPIAYNLLEQSYHNLFQTFHTLMTHNTTQQPHH